MNGDEGRNANESQETPLPPVDEIYSRYYGRMLSFMLTRLSDRETARDLAQEVFLRFLKTNPPASKIKGGIGAYLYGIAKNTIRDHWSGATRVPIRSEGVLEGLESLLREDEQKKVDSYSLEKCLERLKRVDRRILTMRFWIGESHGAIADSVGMTGAGVRKRLQRSLERLRKCLNESAVRGLRRLRLDGSLN